MPKTPSMTAEEAERLIREATGMVPGGLGKAYISTEVRQLVRKWLVAKGLPAAAAYAMSKLSLSLCYNDPAFLAKTIKEAREGIEAEGDDEAPATSETLQVPPVIAAMPPASDRATQALSALQAILGSQGVDEAAVSRIVDARIADAIKDIPTARLDITVGSMPTTTVEGARHEVFEQVLQASAAGLHVLLVGPAGCGKTHLAHQVAEAMRLSFRFTGAVASEYKLLGFMDAQGRLVKTEYRHSYETGGVFLWDEMDASSPSAMLAFNAGLANGHQDFPDVVVKRHENFRAIASANTYGNGADRVYVGRNQMDAASLDRFFVIPMDYDERMERALYGDTEWVRFVHKARASVRKLSMRHVVSMRAIDMGTRLLAAGMDRKQVEVGALWKGLAPADVAKIKAGM